MAVPWINLFANTMGGIGPIELVDLPKINQLRVETGVPFYAGRFYPKNTAEEWNFLAPGFVSETPPWVTWSPMGNTQIWMVPVFEDERVILTQTEIYSINMWPRSEEEEEEIGKYHETTFDRQRQNAGWLNSFGVNDTIDPGIIVNNNVIPPVLFAGYVGISEISGFVSEYAFYDQELIILNGTKYGQPQYRTAANQYGYYGDDVDNYQEIALIRGDGRWVKKDAKIDPVGELKIDYDYNSGFPVGFFRENPATSYEPWVITDKVEARFYGNGKWEQYTKIDSVDGFEVPRAGVVMGVRPSKLDTVVFTIKVSCTTINVPDPMPGETELALEDYRRSALETFGSNLTNNIWYFYMPVRYNGIYSGDRAEWLIDQAAINRLQEGLLANNQS